jgi:predicted anti-sigma-YlaC factor YlaD
MIGNVVPPTIQHVEIDCQEIWKQLANYMEGDLTAEARSRIDEHLSGCRHCTAVYDGTRNVVHLLGDTKLLDLPQGFSERLRKTLFEQAR